MNKVITINLNGNAYQVEEAGYTALSAYLAQAASKLEGNPDKDEIMKDFEQAVAEKFQAFLTPIKNVITADEVQAVLTAMGPVEAEGSAHDAPHANNTSSESTAPRRLHTVAQGAVIMGVCAGIADYLQVDVSIVRILFVLLTILTSGGFILVYFIMGIMLPHDLTFSSQGTSMPFSAHEFIQQAQTNYSQFRTRDEWKQWKRSLKRNLRNSRRYGMYTNADYSMPIQPPAAPYLFPFINLAKALLTVALIVGFISIIVKHAIFGIVIPSGWPIVFAVILLFIAYRIVKFPLQWVKYRAYYPVTSGGSNYQHPQWIFWHTLSSIIWFGVWITFGWFAYNHVPAIHNLFVHIYSVVQQAFSS